MLRGRLLTTFVTMALAASAPALGADQTSTGAQSDNQLAFLGMGLAHQGRQVPLPQILSPADEDAYRRAFDAEARGEWAAADGEIAGLGDRLLVGNLLAIRYLALGYKAKYAELKDWLAQYSTLPQAEAIYALARKRLGAGAKPGGLVQPARLAEASAAAAAVDADWTNFTIDNGLNLPPAAKRRILAIKERFRQRVWGGHFDSAIDILRSVDAASALAPVDADELKTQLALAYFEQADDEDAVRWAAEAAERSGDAIPEAHWIAGLALWRSGHREESIPHFESLANADGVSNWLCAAGAFWAARANLASRHPEVVNHWLEQASLYPRTFYGLLARRQLGLDIEYSWDDRPFTDSDADALLRIPGATRALAFLELGDKESAEDELRALLPPPTPSLAQSLLALAHAADMPDLIVSLGRTVSSKDGRYHDASAYPVPSWRPRSGWTIDRALVLAFARQESGFDPLARSRAGALGLMQIMPATARAMGSSGRLTDPGESLEVGQRYIRHLLADDGIRGNLILMTASYNSGPGNVARWMQTIPHNDDALLFMESIPVRETRVFVVEVLTNYWAYHDRLGQSSSSLDALAAGLWPIYDGNASGSSVRHAKN